MRSDASTYFTIAATAAVMCLLFLPRVNSFIPNWKTNVRTYVRHRPQGSSVQRDMTRLPDGMPVMPKDVVKYSQVPKVGTVFTATTIPSGLLKQHNTKKGTWGIIRVLQGQLEYSIIEPERSTHILDKDNHGVIEPTRLHHVKALSSDLEFVVEFWRLPGTGVVDEKREGLNE
eukprot:CCRYP_000205-RA/>CCRYP_000205-RA protein AED:0.18 eAED:0.18 QI:108/1/1/1/1/1/3/3506/172